MLSKAWQDLFEHRQALSRNAMLELFSKDPLRFDRFSIEIDDLLFDYSKQNITEETLEKLCILAESSELTVLREALFSGEEINLSEKRAAMHPQLRSVDPSPEIAAMLDHMAIFAEKAKNSFKDVICLGIGGSELGPLMTAEALKPYHCSSLNLHFISNIDGKSLASCLKQLDPEKTLCIISSKTFTTTETLNNAKKVKAWFHENLKDPKAWTKHFAAVTANRKAAIAFGISAENLFLFWDTIGGRYSIWSAVGLPLVLMIGISQFQDFLKGGYLIDQHFLTAPFANNIPVIMGLLSIWNRSILGYSTQAILPYDDGLKQFPAYLQQLEMESNGKSVDRNGQPLNVNTAPVVWGGVGCNNQHAYMQLLHQGTEIVPVDFLISATASSQFIDHHYLMVANCLAQSQALMEGRQASAEKNCPGNRPSSTLMYRTLSPKMLGMLIALYEHKVFVQGVIWGINSFDQWGVELGKQLAQEILPLLDLNAEMNVEDKHLKQSALDSSTGSSTRGLIEFFKKHQS